MVGCLLEERKLKEEEEEEESFAQLNSVRKKERKCLDRNGGQSPQINSPPKLIMAFEGDIAPATAKENKMRQREREQRRSPKSE